MRFVSKTAAAGSPVAPYTCVSFASRSLAACAAVALLAAPPLRAAIPAGERTALLDLYNATGGPGWTNKTNWTFVGVPECTWFGVTCNGTATSVVKLELPANKLIGTLPTTLGNLTNLVTLDLSQNKLSGPIPPQVVNLPMLQILYLYRNQLGGSIPTAFASTPALKEIDLSENQLTGAIPSQIGFLPALTHLVLQNNLLTGSIPASLGSLSNLRYLILSSNQLTGGIPGILGNLSLLVQLSLSRNPLGGTIPLELGALSSLVFMDLNNAQLTGGIPAQLGNIGSLTTCHLQDNDLSGSLPSQLGSLTALGILDVSRNHLSGPLPSSLGSLTNLQWLLLDRNAFSGAVPASFVGLTSLVAGQLDLGYNALYSTDPALTSFLSSKQPGWPSTQTVAPTGVSTGPVTPTSVTVSWTPIAYGGGAGYYQVSYAIPAQGQYMTFPTVTADKLASSLVVTGLTTGQPYSFRVTTTSSPGVENQNSLTSEPSATALGTPACSSLAFSPSSLPSPAPVGTPYGATVQASGGTSPYTYGATGLPPGLSIGAATGTISGTPTTLGSYTVHVTVTDSLGCPGAKDYPLTISCPTLTLLPASLPAGIPGQAYGLDITATGGTFPYTFAATAGAVPPGLTLTAAGFLYGIPTTSGVYDFTVTATDSKGCTGSRPYSLTISCAPITITPASLPAAAAGVPYENVLQASGGVAPYQFSRTGNLPAGLALSSDGRISGTPTSPGAETFTVTATDARGCTGTRTYSLAVTCGGIVVSLSPSTLPDGAVGVPYALTITASGGMSPHTFQASGDLPPGLGLSSSGELSGTPSTAGSFNFEVIATDAAGCTGSRTYGLTVTAPCPAPGAPELSVVPGGTAAGQSLLATWTAAAGLQDGGIYVVETSRSASFVPLESSTTATSTWLVLPTAPSATDGTLSVRVRAAQPCGTAGPASASLAVVLTASGPNVLLSRSAPSLIAAVGEPAPSGTVGLRNTGLSAATLAVSVDGGSFDVSPTSLDLAPGAETAVTFTARASSMTSPGARVATLVVTGGGPTLRTPLLLTVVPSPVPAGSRAGTRARPDVTTVAFAAPAGQNPEARRVTISVDPVVGPGPVYLAAAIAPGGSWLRLGDELSQPLTLSAPLTLTLSVDRSARSGTDGPPTLRTLLTLTPVGANAEDAAVLEVLDAEPLPVVPGDGRGSVPRDATREAREALAVLPPPTGSSFLVPAVVKASGANQSEFFSDGWLRNVTSTDVPVDLYFTPRDKNGLVPADVLKVTTTLPASRTMRVADLLGSLFKTSGSGQLEIRSQVPQALTLRTTVEAVTGGDATLRFGTEIPAVSYRSGAGAGDGELVLAGISDDPRNRCNLIVAETTGNAATFEVAVVTPAGETKGVARYEVLPYGQVQINGFVKAIVPGLDLAGGWASVRVVAGSGRVLPIATRIDNGSNSFSAIRGSRVTSASARAPESGSASAPADYIVPAMVSARGANDTRFVTSLSMVNGTAREIGLELTYRYDDLDTGETRTATATVRIPPRGALPKSLGDDVLSSLFGVTGQSRGWVKVRGDVGAVIAVAAISTPVDPFDPSRGLKTAQVNGLLSTAPAMLSSGVTEHRFAGMEKSIAKRTNLVLVETAGQSAQLTLRATSAAGQVLKEMTANVGPNQYFQINDLFGPSGLALGDGPFTDVELSARVTSGDGRVVGLVTVNDNLSKNPSIFILEDAGPPAPSIGF